jgi:hypothetical protein
MTKNAPPKKSLVPSFAALVFAGSVLVSVHAAGPAETDWNLDLVPKAFQRNPKLDMTVITDVTDAGKKLPPVSPQAPAYYVAHSGGYRAVGEQAGQTVFPAAETERLLKTTLAQRGFQPATPAHPPSLLIVYTWGPHNYPDVSDEAASSSQDSVIANVLDRAALAGGDKFAAEVRRAIEQRVANYETLPSHGGGGSSDADALYTMETGMDPVHLSATAALYQMNQIMDPVKMLADKSPKNEFLISQAGDDCYYVVASAYDYRSVAENRRQLLWRTRMTVNARAVAQAQALPTLIVTAGPYLGRDMTEPEVMTKRALDRAHIEIGEAKVIEMPASTPRPVDGK